MGTDMTKLIHCASGLMANDGKCVNVARLTTVSLIGMVPAVKHSVAVITAADALVAGGTGKLIGGAGVLCRKEKKKKKKSVFKVLSPHN